MTEEQSESEREGSAGVKEPANVGREREEEQSESEREGSARVKKMQK